MIQPDKSIRSYRDLLVWQKAMELVDLVYDLADTVPSREEYRLTAQLTRAAVSVPANIAEGHGRFGAKEFANFLSIARGSLNEVETLLLIAVRRGYLKPESLDPVMNATSEIGRMLNGLRAKLPSQR